MDQTSKPKLWVFEFGAGIWPADAWNVRLPTCRKVPGEAMTKSSLLVKDKAIIDVAV